MCIMAAGALAGAAGGAMGGLGSMLQIGFSVMGQVMQYQGQMAQYNEQMRHRAEQAKQAQETLNQQVTQQQASYESELNKTQQEKFKVTKAALVATSRASASAAESGVTGLSVSNLLGEIEMGREEFLAEANYNTEIADKNVNNELKMARRGAEARVASIPIPTRPSFAATAIGIGQSIVSGMNQPRTYGTPGVTLRS